VIGTYVPFTTKCSYILRATSEYPLLGVFFPESAPV